MRFKHGRSVGCLVSLLLCACATDHGMGSGTGGKGGAGASGAKSTAGGTGGARATGGGGNGRTGNLPAEGAPCVVSSVTAEIAVTNIDKVDMLFMIDNSDSMAGKQAKLGSQLPHLMTVMTTGDIDGDGKIDFPPATDLHLGVVTSDMGLPGVQGIQNCQGLGQDGILQNRPTAAGMGCQASYPPFLTFKGGVNQPLQTATDLACVAAVGTGGCGFEHPLEASLKALWPKTDPMATNGMNRIQFLTDPTSGLGATGHGDVENIGFLRNDPVRGLSLIAVIVLTDEDDCSSSDTRAFTPAQYLDPNDPLVMEGLSMRCHYNQQALYPVDRYINGLKALRPGNENLVVFAAIAGVPGDLVDPAARSKTDFSAPDQRDRFYRNILNDQRMQEVIDNLGTPDPSDDELMHSCVEVGAGSAGPGQMGAADPAIRIVRVAQGFGENGIVQSICEADYGPALDAIVGVISKQLGAVCLPRSLVRDASGLVNCDVVWELPPPGMAPPSTPIACDGSNPWLLSPAAGEVQTSDKGGAICNVAQLAVMQDPSGGASSPFPTTTNGQTFTQGWFYDDFSDEVKKSCTGPGDAKQRISFTADAKPPTGVTVKLKCLNQAHSVTSNRTDIITNIQQPTLGAACQNATLNGKMLSGDAACAVTLAKPSQEWPDGIDKSMFCHPVQNTCALSCSSDADCPSAWTCDSSKGALASSGNRPFCTAPSCSPGAKSASSASVGHACLPDVTPESGFDDREVYLGTNSADCGGGVCIAYHLRGNPLASCVAGAGTTPNSTHICASATEVQSRVYCTCRCNAPDGYAECGCPSGFACVSALDQGGPEIRGGYCVKNGTFTQ